MENNRQTIFSITWLILVFILGMVVPLNIIARLPIMEYVDLISFVIFSGCWITAPIISYFIVMPLERLYEKCKENKTSRSLNP